MAASAITASPVAAADLPVPGPAPAAYRPPPIYDWTGFYVGGQAGVGNMRDTFTQMATTPLFVSGSTDRTNPWGVVGGAEAGVNFQFTPIVVGFEGTWTASALSGTQVTPTLFPLTSVYQTSASHWFATATARIGYAANDMLFYLKGGGAWMRATYTEQPFSTINGFNVQQAFNSLRTGWTVGGGFEYGLTENLSLKLEYDFLDFGTRNYNFTALAFQMPGGPPLPPSTPVTLPVSNKSSTSLLTAGVNYRFNWR